MTQNRAKKEGAKVFNIPIKEKTCITQAFNTSIGWQIIGEVVTMVKGGQTSCWAAWKQSLNNIQSLYYKFIQIVNNMI